jgi:predicted nucleic acid-binding protein
MLVDAGPLTAMLNRRDRDHTICVSVLKLMQKPLLSTWMPVTEAMHLLGFSATAQSALLDMIERGALKILEIGIDDLPEIRTLMSKYRDQPMDFADATLVQVARRETLHDIFTLDRRDFGVYRLKQNKPFSIFPN